MRLSTWCTALLGSLLLSIATFGSAQAQATRTWVSGTGDDANPCSRTAPCKTFAGAISKTATGGEIDVQDPGGFGSVTITKSITIDGSGGSTAGVLAAGTQGMTINGVGAVVTIRNIDFEGVGFAPTSPGTRGIWFLSGAELHVQRCVIRNFRDASNGTGISFTPSSDAKLFVSDTVLSNNGNTAVGGGINIKPTAGNTVATLVRVSAEHNNVGVIADSSGGGSVALSVFDSNISGSDAGGITAKGGAAGTPTSKVMVNRTLVMGNTLGLNLTGVTAILRVGESVITGNATAAKILGGSMTSYGNNQMDDNTAVGSPIPVMGPT